MTAPLSVAASLLSIGERVFGWLPGPKPRLTQRDRRIVDVLPLDFRIELQADTPAIWVRCYVLNRWWWPITVTAGTVNHLQVSGTTIDRIALRDHRRVAARSWDVISLDRELTPAHIETLRRIGGRQWTTTVSGSVTYQRWLGGSRSSDIRGEPWIQGVG